jgi:hypothetical protein
VLDIKNRCLLRKWLFKILSKEGVWQEMLTNKYLCGKMLSQVQAKPTDSPFWKGIMGLKTISLNMVPSLLGTVQEHGFGKMFGLEILH